MIGTSRTHLKNSGAHSIRRLTFSCQSMKHSNVLMGPDSRCVGCTVRVVLSTLVATQIASGADLPYISS